MERIIKRIKNTTDTLYNDHFVYAYIYIYMYVFNLKSQPNIGCKYSRSG